MTVCEPFACVVGVRGAAKESVGERRHLGEQRLQRGDRARSHTAAGRGVERIAAKALEPGDAQRVDRRLGENEPGRIGAAGGSRKSDFDPPVREPLYVGPRTSTWATTPSLSK